MAAIWRKKDKGKGGRENSPCIAVSISEEDSIFFGGGVEISVVSHCIEMFTLCKL